MLTRGMCATFSITDDMQTCCRSEFAYVVALANLIRLLSGIQLLVCEIGQAILMKASTLPIYNITCITLIHSSLGQNDQAFNLPQLTRIRKSLIKSDSRKAACSTNMHTCISCVCPSDSDERATILLVVIL